jgi:hypothetical protein
MTTLTSDRQTEKEPLQTYNTFSPKTERMYREKWASISLADRLGPEGGAIELPSESLPKPPTG